MNLLTKEELNELLTNISPHSFKHNIVNLMGTIDVAVAAELVTDRGLLLEALEEGAPEFSKCVDMFNNVHASVRSSEPDETIGQAAVSALAGILGMTVIRARITAAQLGIPLEEVQDVLTATFLKNKDDLSASAVNTVLFGLASPAEIKKG